ncbi:MAG: BTAD domain-containing putative transcriptional regulator [Pseudomonadota bacterium]
MADGLWPNSDPAKARKALNTAIWRMRQVPAISDRLETPSRDTILFASDCRTWIDTAAFVRKCDRAFTLAGRKPSKARRVIKQALALYQPRILGDCHGDWALVERTRLENRWLDATMLAARLAFEAKDYGEAEYFAKVTLEYESFREEAHVIAIQSVALQGDRLKAQKLYADFRNVLMRELDAEPAFTIEQLISSNGRSDDSAASQTPYLCSIDHTQVLRRNLRTLRSSLDRFEEMLGTSLSQR